MKNSSFSFGGKFSLLFNDATCNFHCSCREQMERLEFVPARVAHKKYPQEVIKFYESRICSTKNKLVSRSVS